MKTLTGVEVKSGVLNPDTKKKESKVVAKIDINQYDSVNEAQLSLGEPATLSLINTQYATNAKNKARSEATSTPSAKSLQNEAFTRILRDAGLLAQLQAIQGDTVRQDALIAEVVAQIKKEKGIEEDATPAEEESAGG